MYMDIIEIEQLNGVSSVPTVNVVAFHAIESFYG